MTGGPSPIVFDAQHSSLAALTWKPTYAEAQAILMHDLYGNRYDGLQMRTIHLPETWPRWATVVGIALPAALVLGAIPLFMSPLFLLTFVAQGLVISAAFFALLAIGIFSLIRYTHRVGDEGWRRVKLERLATDNGLVYTQRAAPPLYPGCVFTTGTSSPYVFNDFSTTNPRPVDFGNFCSVSGVVSGAGAAIAPTPEKSWGFLAIELDQQLPSLLLVSKLRQPGDLSLPVTPDPRAALSLEGDFDKYFTLYCAQGSEQDALYVVTPDLMALLIDEASPFDVEIAGNWMFFYSRIPFDMLDASVYQRLFGILQTIGGKVIGQSRRYGGFQFAAVPVPMPVAPAPRPVLVSATDSDEGRHVATASDPATDPKQASARQIGTWITVVFGGIIILAIVITAIETSVRFG